MSADARSSATLVVNITLFSLAGHVEVVSFLLNKVRTIQVDPVNNLGFTPLMKAALQGRVKCSKLLLFSGEYTG